MHSAANRVRRLAQTTTQGGRTSTRAYGLKGYLESVVDPLFQARTFTIDAVGRVLAETRPDGKQELSGWDAVANRVSVTPPGRPGHRFGFSPVD